MIKIILMKIKNMRQLQRLQQNTKRFSSFLIMATLILSIKSGTYAQKNNERNPNLINGSVPALGKVITEKLISSVLRNTKTGVDTNRIVKIYLPPGYETSGKSYPVVYYFHNLNWSAEKMFESGNVQNLLDRAFATHVVNKFILVAADYSTDQLGSWYENSAVTGRWLDFTVDELVPFVDSRFRTIKNRDSRGLVGDFVGGRGALVLSMLYPDLFSVMYAMHPVATGTGPIPMISKVDWKKIHEAKSFAELDGGFARPYVSIMQAFLPNPDRPPFYCDFMVEMDNGEPKLNAVNMAKLKDDFLLDQKLRERADNLRKMRGIGFDWARYDPNYDHVYANQQFTLKLDELGIEHEAEEYRGDPWSNNFTDHGRFYTRVLPFLSRHLAF
jgi:S-formylglutathione hydrolase FrmB